MFVLCFFAFFRLLCDCHVIDPSAGNGRTFDGIGGLSGGGASSKLLISYPEPERSYILDFLFKPNFGASLHILKVEICGDGQSGMGTESSHMHSEGEENYNRGYEWWLMKEAKNRNPKIKLYGLPWTFPGWISRGSGNPFKFPNVTAHYILKWITGAKIVHGLNIDYLGIANERMYDITYIETLRATMDLNGLSHIQIVAADRNYWDISKDILKYPALAKAISIIGRHYPSTMVNNYTLETKKTIWASEDYSTFNDNTGAGCWARTLNQNYVSGHMTSTIAWNLIASYYQDLPYGRDGLMTAIEPWSAHYVVESPIWATAHTTQFTEPGMRYLAHGYGVGKLDKGGSFVTFIDETDPTKLTLVIETITHEHSACLHATIPMYAVTPQNATFQLKGSLKQIKYLFVWYSKLGFSTEKSVLFQKQEQVKVDVSGYFTLSLGLNEIWTLTTLDQGQKGSHPTPPLPKPFPLPYKDNFESYALNSEAAYFVPMAGVWEVRRSSLQNSSGQVYTQVVTQQPVAWCVKDTAPINIAGNYNWSDTGIQVDIMIPTTSSAKGVFVATHVDKGGCYTPLAQGFYFWMFTNNTYMITYDYGRKDVITQDTLKLKTGVPFTVSLYVSMTKSFAVGSVNGRVLFKVLTDPTKIPVKGFLGFGVDNFGIVEFDNVLIT